MAYKNSETRHAHYLKNRDYICGQRNAHRLANLEIERAKAAAYQTANPGKVREWQRIADASRKHQPERIAKKSATRSQRRANQANASLNDLTHAQWMEIQSAQDHCCAHCKKRCKGKLSQDHVTPLSKGGSHTLHNVIGVCRSCNSKKGTRPSPVLVQPMLLTIAPSKKKKAA